MCGNERDAVYLMHHLGGPGFNAQAATDAKGGIGAFVNFAGGDLKFFASPSGLYIS